MYQIFSRAAGARKFSDKVKSTSICFRVQIPYNNTPPFYLGQKSAKGGIIARYSGDQDRGGAQTFGKSVFLNPKLISGQGNPGFDPIPQLKPARSRSSEGVRGCSGYLGVARFVELSFKTNFII